MKRKTIEILVGIPCSGKSSYSKKQYLSLTNQAIVYLSRDEIRENKRSFPKQPYVHTKENEDKVTKLYNLYLLDYLEDSVFNTIILDNTHCKEKYIDEIINKFGNDHDIKIKFFDLNIVVAHFRNIVRRYKTGKWIPVAIMNNMYKNYNKINRAKYGKYMVY